MGLQIAKEAENCIYYKDVSAAMRNATHHTHDLTETTAAGAVEASFKCHAKAIVVVTSSGR